MLSNKGADSIHNDIFTEYVRKYSDTVYRVAYSYTQSRPDSEDIMQDVLLKLYQCGKSFSDDEHVKAWLIRVTINKAKDTLKASCRKHNEELSENTPYIPPKNTALCEAMASLSEDYRVAVYLHYYEGYDVKEIAQLLKITESNVKIRLKRARDKLKDFLTDT